MKKRGFTLVELLVVIAVLAILATLAVVGYVSFIDKAHQQRADTEAAQIKKVLEGALILDEELYLGTANEKECYFSKKGLRVDGVIANGETVLTSLAGDLAHLKGTLVAYPNGYFKWITEDGAFYMFKIEVEGVWADPGSGDLKEYLENHFKTYSECLIGTYMGRSVYVNSRWEVLVEHSPAASVISGAFFDVDTAINPEIHAITPQITVTVLFRMVFMVTPTSPTVSTNSSLNITRNGYYACLTYLDKNGNKGIVAKDNICGELLGMWWTSFSMGYYPVGSVVDHTSVVFYSVYFDRENNEFSLVKGLGDGKYEELSSGTCIVLDSNDTALYGKLTIGVDDINGHYIHVKHGEYEETVYLSTLK